MRILCEHMFGLHSIRPHPFTQRAHDSALATQYAYTRVCVCKYIYIYIYIYILSYLVQKVNLVAYSLHAHIF